MKFYKMENEENDFIILNLIEEPLPDTPKLSKLVLSFCQSHRLGVGADGLILLLPSTDPATYDYKIRIFNANGTELATCGNALACVGEFVKNLYGKTSIKLETNLGIYTTEHTDEGIRVDLGEPTIDSEKDVDINGKTFHFYCVTIGGVSHAVTFINIEEDGMIEEYEISEISQYLEKNPEFANSTNIDFVQSVYEGLAQVKFWKRGIGEINSSGTGSCAALIASSLRYDGDVDRDEFRVEVFPTNPADNEIGGILYVSWSKFNNHVYLEECHPTCTFRAEFNLTIPKEGYLYPSIQYNFEHTST